MLNHDRFEELCVLAAAGELSAPDARLLDAHLESCGACRGVMADMEELHSQVLPLHDVAGATKAGTEDLLLRQTILRQAELEGARFSPGARSSGYMPQSTKSRLSIQFVISAAAMLVAMALGIVFAARATHQQKPVMSGRQNDDSENSLAAVAEIKNELSQVSQKRQNLEEELENERVQSGKLAKQLEREQAALAASQGEGEIRRQMIESLKEQLESARTKEKDSEAELERVKVANDRDVIGARYEIQELKETLASNSASLDREREMLSAGREIRDLISARNLHIIDVYDTNSQGKTSPAFGRVFYTEGKSLVFYAYDLDDTHKMNMAKFAFYVWGKRDRTPQDVKNLGRMSTDDREQKRWALTITDPKVLAEIDSVFVTLEPTDPGLRPSGKSVLSAFLGTAANHP